ncbi:hypothetical protein T484DRAFT_1860140 [Baffinella frigidus]|nr:hypothetical protein T484DRAFT_1860140 [Cryptophyta sp. CCMP2293]
MAQGGRVCRRPLLPLLIVLCDFAGTSPAAALAGAASPPLAYTLSGGTSIGSIGGADGETTVGGVRVVRSRSPAEALGHGEWFKLICGASNQDAPQGFND